MVRKITRLAICFAAGLFAITLGVNAFAADEKKAEKALSIEEIMKPSFGGKNSLQKKIAAATKAEKWEDAQKAATELKTLGAGLGKNETPKGDAASWKKLSAKYAEQTADISAAADKKDLKATNAALGVLGKSCKECHDAHRE